MLAGGAATRLGGAKATAELAGKPLITYPLEALSRAGIEAVVVAKADSPLPPLDLEVITEPDEPRHPLAGVIAALKHAHPRPALTLPCDTPFISPMLIRVLATATDTTAVRSSGRVHPLVALYNAENLEQLDQAMATGKPATEALESLQPTYLEASETETFNVNTPADLVRAEAILKRTRS